MSFYVRQCEHLSCKSSLMLDEDVVPRFGVCVFVRDFGGNLLLIWDGTQQSVRHTLPQL